MQQYTKKDIEDVYGLTPTQEAMIFHNLRDEEDPAVDQFLMKISGNIDTTVFRESLKHIIKHHTALRTSFVFKKVKANMQIVLKDRQESFEYHDIRLLPVSEKDNYVDTFRTNTRRKGFDLTRDTLIRFDLIHYDEGKYYLLLTNHHIIIDGWCLSILFSDLFLAYQALLSNKEFKLNAVKPYGDYLKWIKRQDENKTINFWKDYLSEYTSEASIPYLNKNIDNAQYKYVEKTFLLPDETSQIKSLVQECKITLSTFLQTIWGIILQKYNNTNDVVFGYVVSGRPADLDGVENILGLFINTVPLRIKSTEGQNFKELLNQVQQSGIDILKYGYISYHTLLEKTKIARDTINHLYVFQNYPISNNIKSLIETGELGFTLDEFITYDRSNYNFNIVVYQGESLGFNLKCNQIAIDDESIDKIASHVKSVISEVLKNPEILIKDIEIASETEKEHILNKNTALNHDSLNLPDQGISWNNTYFPYLKDKSLNDAFIEVVGKFPDKTSVVDGERKISYSELNLFADYLAAELQKSGLQQGDFVVVMIDRSFFLPLSLLAIIKAGGVYVPIDPSYPKERIEYMLSDCKPKTVICDSNSIKNVEGIETINIINIDNINLPSVDERESIVEQNNYSGQAYAIYTSGSTGLPKCTINGHNGILSLQKFFIHSLKISSNDNIIQYANSAFDASLWDMAMALLSGAELHILKKEIIENYNEFTDYLNSNNITVATLPPPYIANLNPSGFNTLKKLITAGSATNVDLVRLWNNKKINYYNAYGPTETSICSTIFDCNLLNNNHATVPIGKPIFNQRVYILDKNSKLCPVGIPGELCVSADGLALGYLNKDDLYKKQFINNPYEKGEIMYKTGDIAKWLPDGNIEFLGRIDNQVKIRGHRVELGEIENKLIEHPALTDVFVCDYEQNNNVVLCAYYTKNEEEIQVSQLSEFLKAKLPDYFVPQYFIELKEFPLSPSGKIEKKLLPLPEISTSEYIPPTNEIEQILTSIWAEALGIDKVSIEDEFYEIGGDSIKAIRIISMLQQKNLNIKVKEIIQYKTIKKIAEFIRSNDYLNSQESIIGDFPLNQIQNWFLNTYKGNVNHFNMSVLIHAKDGINTNSINEAVKQVINHHDALRTKFNTADNKLFQTISEDNSGDYFEIINLGSQQDYWETIENEGAQLQKSLDISNGIVFKSVVFKTINGDYLFLVAHHAVVDVISWTFILDDIKNVYYQLENNNEVVLPYKTSSFKSWSNSISQYSNSPEILKNLPYWKGISEKIKDSITPDFVEETNSVIDSETLSLELTKDQTQQLVSNASKVYGTNAHENILSVLLIALKKWTDINAHSIMIESHGREELFNDLDITRTAGWFTAMYPVILESLEFGNISQLVNEVKSTIRHIPNNGIDYSILKYLSNKHLISDNIPQISFNYHGKIDWSNSLGGGFELIQKTIGENQDVNSQRFHLIDIISYITNDSLNFNLTYNKKQFKKETVQRFMDLFSESLKEFLIHSTSSNSKKIRTSNSINDSLEIIENTLKKYKVPGAIIGMQLEDEKEIIVPIGVSDPLVNTLMEKNAQFRTGSITKTFVSTVILQLVDKKIVQLDDPVSKFINNKHLANLPTTVSIRKLLNHTSGIADFSGNKEFISKFTNDPGYDFSFDQLMEFSFNNNEQLSICQEDKYLNSNTNYLILGSIIEILTKKNLNDALNELLFKPLNLSNTFIPNGEGLPSDFVSGWQLLPNGTFKKGISDINSKVFKASGDVISTVPDLLKWLKIFTSGKMISLGLQEERLKMVDVSDYFPINAKVEVGLGVFSINGSVGQQAMFFNEFEVLMYNKSNVSVTMFLNKGRNEMSPYLISNEIYNEIIKILI